MVRPDLSPTFFLQRIMSLRSIKQAYVVHTQVLGLDKKPFPNKDILNNAWHPYFCESKCFTKNRELIYGEHPSKPFIPYLGAVWFDPITNVNVTSSFVHYNYRDILYTDGQETREGEWNSVFGFSPEIEDQRMYFLCWSLCNPITIKAKTGNKINATGKIFIQIYPNGYIFMIFAINLDWSQCNNSLDIVDVIQESKPWVSENKWDWDSRIYQGKLNEILSTCEVNLRKSFFNKKSSQAAQMLFNFNNNNWHSLIRIFNDRDDKNEIVDRFNLTNHKILKGNIFVRNNMNFILSSDNISFYTLYNKCDRKKAQIDLWKFHGLLKFVMYKSQIYMDSNRSLNEEIENLKIIRINYLKTPVTWENIVNYTIYDNDFITFLRILDNYTSSDGNIDSFYRKTMYPFLTKSVGLETAKDSLNSVLKNYEEEVKLWEPLPTKFFKLLVAPLNLLMSATKNGNK